MLKLYIVLRVMKILDNAYRRVQKLPKKKTAYPTKHFLYYRGSKAWYCRLNSLIYQFYVETLEKCKISSKLHNLGHRPKLCNLLPSQETVSQLLYSEPQATYQCQPHNIFLLLSNSPSRSTMYASTHPQSASSTPLITYTNPFGIPKPINWSYCVAYCACYSWVDQPSHLGQSSQFLYVVYLTCIWPLALLGSHYQAVVEPTGAGSVHNPLAENSTQPCLVQGVDLVCVHLNGVGRSSLLCCKQFIGQQAISKVFDKVKAVYSAIGSI